VEKDLEAIIKVAKEAITRYGGHQPTLYIKGENGRVFTDFPDFSPDHEGKLRQMANRGVTVACERSVGNLDYLIFVTEAWMGKPCKGEPYVQPSKDPKRIEALCITTLDVRTNKQTMLAYQMVRDKTGNLIELKKLSFPDEVTVESPLFPAFVAGYNLITR